MRLTKPIKVLVGLGTLWVLLYPLLFFVVCLMMFWTFTIPVGREDGPPLFFVVFFAIFPLHLLTILVQMALQVFYLVHVIRNREAAETVRIILGWGPS